MSDPMADIERSHNEPARCDRPSVHGDRYDCGNLLPCSNPDHRPMSDDDPITRADLRSCCKACGLLYEEARGVISPHFALCPRCGTFNEPRKEPS